MDKFTAPSTARHLSPYAIGTLTWRTRGLCAGLVRMGLEPGDTGRLHGPAYTNRARPAYDSPRLATSYGAVHGLSREPGDDHYGLS